MSEIFEKNIKYIKKYNPRLAEKICSITEFSRVFDVNTNLAGEYNLLVDGIPVHSITGAQQEAQCIYEKFFHNSKNSVHIIYGLGLGYLFDVISQNSPANIIVYEPDLETLRFVLDIVDFSVEFEKARSYFVSDVEQLFDVLKSIYKYKTKITFSALDYHVNSNRPLYNSVAEEIEKMNNMIAHNYSFQVKEIYSFYIRTLQALDVRLKLPMLTDSKNLLKNKPALIVSAGPSLSSNIEFVKKYRDNFVIFCVGTALKTLLENDIVPDFLNIIECTDTSIHYNFPETEKIRLICEPYTNLAVFRKNYKNIFITGSDETESSRWFLEKRNREDDYFETKGTVAYHAIFSAYTLGCNPIVLVGQDLAYVNGNCYAKGSCFENLKCTYKENLGKFVIEADDIEKFKESYYHSNKYSDEEKNIRLEQTLKNFNDKLRTVDGQNGEKLPTSSAYALFVSYIESFAKRYGDSVKLLNCSQGGAQINGFENMSLENAVKQYADNALNKEQLFSVLNTDSSKNLAFSVNSLKKDVNDIDKILPQLENGKIAFEKFEKELNMKKCNTDKILDLLDSALNCYIEMSNKYFYPSKLLSVIGAKYISEIMYLIREYETNSSYELTKQFCDALNDFYLVFPKRLRIVRKWLVYFIEQLEV